MAHERIQVSRPVYEELEAARSDDESFDDVLRRLLDVVGESPGESYLKDSNRWTVYDSLVARKRDDEELADTYARVGVPPIDDDEMHVDETEMWTVYDQLVKERREGESLSETLARVGNLGSASPE